MVSAVRVALLVLLLTAIHAQAATEPRWLATVATHTSFAAAIDHVALLAAAPMAVTVVASDDCVNLKKHFFIVAGSYNSHQAAKQAVDGWQARGIADAYVQSCMPAPHSRVALGVPLLDQSFTRRPPDIINWHLTDAMSSTVAINDGITAIVAPYYQADDTGILQGLRINVSLRNAAAAQTTTLATHCIDPAFVTQDNILALSCATGVAADHLLHTIYLFDIHSGKQLASYDQHRNPSFTTDGFVSFAESVDAEGTLHLQKGVHSIQGH